MVLGHQNCGAVAATLKALQPPFAKSAGEVGTLVAAIAPADQIRTTSELTASLDSGAVKLVVGYYSLQDGTVSII